VFVLRQDLRFGARQLWKSQGFACVAALTLALGIGGTAAIFSVIDAVVLRPLSAREPDRLVWLFETSRDLDRSPVSAGHFTEWSERTSAFEAMAAIEWRSVNATDGDLPERLVGARVTAQYFDVVGVAPILGRTFGEAETKPGQEMVVVLSERLWTRRFGRDPTLIGRPIRLSGQTYTVLGVMPLTIDVMSDSEELWTPLVFGQEQRRTFDKHFLAIVARLKHGMPIEQARADVDRIARQLATENPRDLVDRGATAVPLIDFFVGNHRQRLWVMLGAVGLVLLIGCGNIANLLLARGAARSSEFAVRAALGASRWRLTRQLIAENLLLAALGAGAGLVVAQLTLQFLITMGPALPRLGHARVDAATLAFATIVAIVSSLVFGLVPASHATRADLLDGLRGSRSGSIGASRDRLRSALVAVEVALALVLLVGAGLLIQTALALDRVDSGFEARGVLSARVALPKDEYREDGQIVQTLDRMIEETRAVAGVTHAAVTSQIPLGPGFNANGLIPEGRPLEPTSAINSRLRLVSPGYFATMRIAILKGRGFLDGDRRGAQKVMIVSDTLARQAWPGEQAVGKRIACCEPGTGGPYTDFKVVVGVAADVRSSGPAQRPVPEFYLPIAQAPSSPPGAAWDWVQRTMYIVARTPGDAAALAAPVGRALQRVDPTLPLFSVRTMEQRMAGAVAGTRFNTMLLMTLGVVGLLLAALGVYGVIAYFVSLRTQEIGLRLALGASRGDVVRLVIAQAIRPVLAGLVAGVCGALAATRLLAAQLYGVGPRDPGTIALVCVTFVVVALLASWAPARRAASVDPTRALNQG
jgi:putative ABC transport system permease protein